MNNKLVTTNQYEELNQAALTLPSLTLNERQLSDLEMLLIGGFAPLSTFLNQADYASVLATMRLKSGELWPLPVVLDVDRDFAKALSIGAQIALRDQEGLMLAILSVLERWKPDKKQEAMAVYGSADPTHPGVHHLLNDRGDTYISGELTAVQVPLHYAFEALWQTPSDLKRYFKDQGWSNILAFQTSRVVHRVQRDFLQEMAEKYECAVLLHPTVGKTRSGDLEAAARVRCYEAVLPRFEMDAYLALCPITLRQAGPREALWHAIVEKNYGATHFLIGPDDSSPRDPDGLGVFYAPYAAHDLLKSHAKEIGIMPICVEERVYSAKRQAYVSHEAVTSEEPTERFREERLCQTMRAGEAVPVWWSFPEVLDALKTVYRPKYELGFTLFFTGLSGSGKSTLANILNARLVELGSRPVTLLDGDIVRLNLSNELGFSKAHRNINVKRIGFVANQITRNGGVAICAPIAPYQAIRREVRELIQSSGGFIEIHVSTPIDVCEARDVKGLYAKARKGLIAEFTGVSDPYEIPSNAELVINTDEHTPLDAAQLVWDYLCKQGYLLA